MTKIRRAAALAFLFAAGAVVLAAGDVVVLKGGARIELQKPMTQKGTVALLTRSDGTLLSVSASEIDWKATAAARAERAAVRPAPSVTAPPETPAQAARAGREGPRARVKLTDADVSHVAEEETATPEKKGSEAPSGAARLDVVDYSQEKSGNNIAVRGEIRNSGGTPAVGSRMTVAAMDEKGERIASSEAALSNGRVEPGATVSFSVTIPVGEKAVGSIRFSPQWIAPAAPPAAPTPAPGAGGGGTTPAAQKPAPTPTPYGQGTLYAPPVASAPTAPPADDRRGYIPGMSSPENQPKPPN